MAKQVEHSHTANECYQGHLQELAELCDHEFHLSVLPSVTNKERAIRGKNRIAEAIEELKAFQQNIKCVACHKEINRQIRLQEEGLKEIEQAWNL